MSSLFFTDEVLKKKEYIPSVSNYETYTSYCSKLHMFA